MAPIVLFGIQFTFALVVYALVAWCYVAPRLLGLRREAALVPLVWVHVFRIVGGAILARGAVDAAVPAEFRTMLRYGLLVTGMLLLMALSVLRGGWSAAIPLVWLFLAVGLLDTVNAIIQSMRFSVFTHGLGVNWVIVTAYVPALLVSSVLIFIQLRKPKRSTT